MNPPSFRTAEVAQLYEKVRGCCHAEYPFLDANYSPGSYAPAVDFTSLADGRYTLTALATQISGGNFDGDGNGVVGDNYVLASAPTPSPATNIFRLFGDANGDGTVAANDFIAFRLALGGSNPIFDFDNDGAVAASDFIQFRLRFGGSI